MKSRYLAAALLCAVPIPVQAQAFPQSTQKLEAQGLSIIADSPEHFASYVAAESQKWRKVVPASGAKAD